MIRIFQILAVALGAAAAYFFWRDDTERAFVLFVVASCVFFVSVRFGARSRVSDRDNASKHPSETDEPSQND